ncbi:GAF domain-containing protein [Gramella sp. AN32]|uniref:GAF domain-containing protein n=1 Tax=Christiangramia antarctica TaxID=2058158 RepID=A0ABW5X346_9FLAO|nr:GAF domain-containing protein [Gramella sp. AN32]MCM4157073.1 hypothetical protein [Gramella sp. AN32]
MQEEERLHELYSYNILDTAQDKDLDEIAEIASAICNTPIAQISLIDREIEFLKAEVGTDLKKIPRELSFCSHLVYSPGELMIVENLLNDPRFKEHPFVKAGPKARFYAGAPLETPNGNVLGALCVIDFEPKVISEKQKNALKLLAKRVLENFDLRKLLQTQKDDIKSNILKLRKLTDNAPGLIYQFKITTDGKMSFPFLSSGISNINSNLNPRILAEEAATSFVKFLHPDDLQNFNLTIQESFQNLSIWEAEYRLIGDDKHYKWYHGKSKPERLDDGSVLWHGMMQDITDKKEYEETLEKLSFDISHGLRPSVCNMLGITSMIETEKIDVDTLKEYSGYIKKISLELDDFTKKLNETYENRSYPRHKK